MNQEGIPGTYAMLGGPASWKALGYPMGGAESKPASADALEPTR